MEEQRQAEIKAEQAKGTTPLRKYLPWLKRVLQGVVIGVGAILPGISGGVLCVIFGIYQPMMTLLAHPVAAFKKHAALLLPVLIGWAFGFVGLAGVVTWMFETSMELAVCFFIGLIIGMLPPLFKEAGLKGRTTGSWVSFAVSFIVIFALLVFLKVSNAMQVQPNIFWYFVCGVLWGVSLIVPGMSSSSLLIFLGLYYPMTAGIKVLSLEVIIPLIIGIALFVLVSARLVKRLFDKHYSIAYHCILGFVIASTLAIIPLTYKSALFAIGCFGFLALGFAVTWLMGRKGQKVQDQQAEVD
ncbi:MAG: DUF368 domain-containing protein [Christensenellales bacterium]